VQVDVVVFRDFPAVEWVVRLKNSGARDTPILGDILPLDVRMPRSGSGPAVLHYAKRALCSTDVFAPVEKSLTDGVAVSLQPDGGRWSSEVLPLFASSIRFTWSSCRSYAPRPHKELYNVSFP